MPLLRRLPLFVVPVALAGFAVPAPAHATLTDAGVTSSANLHDDASCSVDTTPSSGVSRTLADDGRTVTAVDKRTATVTGSDPGDRVALAGYASSTTRVTPITTAGGSIRFTASLAGSTTPRLATSQCAAHAAVGSNAGASLTLPAPMWVTATIVSAGSVSAEVGVGRPDNQYYANGIGRGTASATYLIQPGAFDFEAGATIDAFQGTGAVSGSATITIAMRPVGAAGPVSGAGRRYVGLQGRYCSLDAIKVSLTKAVKKAKKVEVRLNGVRRIKVTGKQLKRRDLALVVPSSSAAAVTATITTKKGKRVTVSRSYLACS